MLTTTKSKPDKQQQILDAVLVLLADHGISGVSMRAVARQAGVALGLVNYYYTDKTILIESALHRIEQQDIAIVEPDPTLTPTQNLRAALQRVAEPQYLTTGYLSLRLQLWSLAQADPRFAKINVTAQQNYRSGLASLIRAAIPGTSKLEANKRAADIDIIQNGIWLTALLGLDRASVNRSVARCHAIAFQE